MKHKATKQILSILLAVAMLMGVLPMAAIPVFAEEITYTKAGEIGAVTAECAPIAAPTLGGKVTNSFHVTVTSPTDKRLVNPTGDAVQWQRKTGDTWMDYTKKSFDEGTYRLCIRLTSIARSDDSYYALVQTTTLTVNGTHFTPGDAPSDNDYKIWGNASMYFYSQEYTVTKEAGTYLVTVTAGVNGRASADIVYGKTGEVVNLTAEPFTGYRLKEWRVVSGGVTVENNQFTIGSEDVEIRAIFESTNEYLGDIQQIKVTTKEGVDYRPIMGRTAGRIDVTVQSSEPSDGTLCVGGYGCGIWEVKQPDGSWALFNNKPFTYGTYRMSISVRNEVKDGKYHVLTKDTVLIVDGKKWTAEPDSLYTYYSLANGYGKMSFVSEEMDVIPLANVSDSTPAGCYVEPVLGEFTVPMGDAFSFTVEPKDYYELTDPDALKVYVNDILVTPDEDGVYTVENVTENLDIYCDGSGFTSYSNLTVTANGKTVTEKLYVGDTYTFKTLDEFGATVPAGSTFTGWKIGGKTYQPGEIYTVPGGGEIKVNAAFKGLHNITVENGKAYADEAHTIPISAAAEDQVIYIVADPAPEGKVFSYWTEIEIASPGGDGWFGSYDAAETTYTVYYSDVVLAPVYETPIDHIVINGMTKPVAGVAIDNSDYSYKWGCSVPANSGYSLGICYWYDITEGEPESAMSNGDVFQIGHTYRYKAKINLYGDTILAAKEDISVALTGLDADSYTWTISEYSQIYDNMVIYFEFTCEGTAEDVVSVSGSISSYGNPAPVTIELWNIEGTSAAYSTTISGDSTTYSIPNVATGVYELIVSKAGHMPYHYIFVAQGESVTQDAELRLYADTNLDGEINIQDYQSLVNTVLRGNHVQSGTAKYDELIHYDLVMDGYTDVLDAAVMALLVNGQKTIYEVYDIKKGDYNSDGEAFTESDIVAMHHILSDIDSSAPTLSTSQKFAADLNCNGEVDEGDLKRLVSIYGEIEGVTCEDNVKVYYSWGNSYSTCTATAICILCNKKVAVETVNSVNNGDGTYTATFTNTLFGTKTFKKTT